LAAAAALRTIISPFSKVLSGGAASVRLVNPSSRIRGFLKSPHQADQWLNSKGLHYSACLFSYRHMYVDHFLVLISRSAAGHSQRV
jgi:hypothetical protein